MLNQKKYQRLIPYLLAICTLSSGSAVAWEYGLLDGLEQLLMTGFVTAPTIEKPLLPPTAVSDSLPQYYIQPMPREATKEVPREEEEEEVFRTSDSYEISAGYPRANPNDLEGFRVGCICMDGLQQQHKGAGACSGHGGVRFWLYEEDGELLELPTARHKHHPTVHAFREQQRIAKANGSTVTYSPYYPSSATSENTTIYELLMLLIFCVTMAYIAKQKWSS